MQPTFDNHVRELDMRVDDGLLVALYWDSRTDRLYVDVEDQRADDRFRILVGGADALDAFRHPYIYRYALPEQIVTSVMPNR
jgi:hypothetical protein